MVHSRNLNIKKKYINVWEVVFQNVGNIKAVKFRAGDKLRYLPKIIIIASIVSKILILKENKLYCIKKGIITEIVLLKIK